ncbi:ATP-binding protein [Streptomyces sp. NPDC047002]|uniref:ATP-binding protein n=1 Tax=Streptomyces sp. NPDC047002 TaxID=3155475 RepID=UPI0034572354
MARSLVRRALSVWGQEELIRDGAGVVSELVANAVQHARGCQIRVSVSVDRSVPGCVRIAVTDMDRSIPCLRSASDEEESGRGLLLVDALTECWGTDILAQGKRIWADLKPGATP